MDVVQALKAVKRAREVAVVDSLVVAGTPSASVDASELAELPHLSCGATPRDRAELIGAEHADEVASTMASSTTALILLTERVWARDAAAATNAAGDNLSALVRDPAEHVDEAMADLEATS